VRWVDPLGREARFVECDPVRAPLIRPAFRQYAKGGTTIRQLAETVAAQGLQTPPTPKNPARAVTATALQRSRTNRHHLGEVSYKDDRHAGRHEPLATPDTWQQVQDVLAANRVGEKVHERAHDLKSTVYYAECGSRLIYSQVNLPT
jgi:hypothetical protein